MEQRGHRQIVLTHWNAGVFQSSTLPQILPELVIYALLYDDVLLREEDLLTNRLITRLLSEPEHLRVFEELLTAGFVKLLRLPVDAYPAARLFDPAQQPSRARAEEHQLRRSYKGRPWKPTDLEWQLFRRLDHIVAQHPTASRFHAPFPPDNPFATELAELLENREEYRLRARQVFRHIHPETADAFIQFCRDPEAWRRFLRDSGVRSIIVGSDGGFYRSAAYQCLRILPTPRSMRRLVESVYAVTYCDREDSDGRYGGSELVELPYRYELEKEREAAEETITRIEVVPTGAGTSIAVGPGVSTVLVRTRESPAFGYLQRMLDELGSAPSETSLPTEATFREAWRNLCAVYTDHSTGLLTRPSAVDKKIPRYAVLAYVLTRVFGFIIVPHGLRFDIPVAADAATIAAMEHLGPSLVRGFRALLKSPAAHQSVMRSITVRCSRVMLNKKPK